MMAHDFPVLLNGFEFSLDEWGYLRGFLSSSLQIVKVYEVEKVINTVTGGSEHVDKVSDEFFSRKKV